MEERYPGGKTAGDGRYVVEFPVADPNWLAREVLQYGAEAEVLGPEGMREFVRGSLGAVETGDRRQGRQETGDGIEAE